jgi:hypothetical protein
MRLISSVLVRVRSGGYAHPVDGRRNHHRVKTRPAFLVECRLDVSRSAFHLSMVDRLVGSARGQDLGRRLDRALQWTEQNLAIVPMAVSTSMAAIFIKQAWIQRLALTIQIGGWILYFAVFQSALSE